MTAGGLTQGIASPCLFWTEDWNSNLLVHGDEFFAVGPMNGLQKFKELMKSNYECKVDCIGARVQDEKELRVLVRVISS